MNYVSAELFSGCGGLSLGMRQAGFDVAVAVEIDQDSVSTYRLNHPKTHVIHKDIRAAGGDEIMRALDGQEVYLLAGCPPCQGFSTLRKLNKRRSVTDSRNSLLMEFLRIVKLLKPKTIMLENVPGLRSYYLFNQFVKDLIEQGYSVDFRVVDLKNYGVPQRRKRLVLVGSLLGTLIIAPETDEEVTVWDSIGGMESVRVTKDPIHAIIPKHTPSIQELISLIPIDGGSRKDLPDGYTLACHKRRNTGFSDIYGRLTWSEVASTITSGCLNPSKGRFLHPVKNRTISAREASMLQTFPIDYKFPSRIGKESLASMIGNALPPKFSFIQCANIKHHLDHHLG